MDAPAEVDVLAEQGHARIEAASPLPDVPADQHSGAGDREGVPVAVVLPLVDLTRLDAGDAAARRIERQPGLGDDVPVGPVHELGAEYHGRRGLRRPAQQLLERVGRGLAVVVQQPQPLGLLALVTPAARGSAA